MIYFYCPFHGRAEKCKLTAQIWTEIAEENNYPSFSEICSFSCTHFPKVHVAASKLVPSKARVDRLHGDTCPYVCPQTGLN